MNFQSKIMNLNERNNVFYLTFKALDTQKFQFVKHAFSTRIGGVSKDQFSTMNLSFKVGDPPENVLQNFEIFCKALGFDKKNLVIPEQTHSNNVKIVTKSDTIKENFTLNNIKNTDGLITNEPEIVLMTSHADCNSLFFVDPEKKIIGLAHAGWRGTVSKIAEKMVNSFIKNFGCKKENIICCMGPAICQNCFEIKNDTLKNFLNMNLSQIDKFISKNSQKNNYKINLFGINQQILLNLEIPKKNIIISDLCTKCHPEFFYSHRISGLNRGSMAAFLSIN